MSRGSMSSRLRLSVLSRTIWPRLCTCAEASGAMGLRRAEACEGVEGSGVHINKIIESVGELAAHKGRTAAAPGRMQRVVVGRDQAEAQPAA